MEELDGVSHTAIETEDALKAYRADKLGSCPYYKKKLIHRIIDAICK
jgi:hypothetical protein